MLATVLCIVTALASPFLVGLPVRRLLRRGRPLTERAWLEAPFVGVAIIILALQNLVYLDVPLRRSIPWFWLAVGLLWLAVRPWREWTEWRRNCPRVILAACVGVYLIQGLGLLSLGAPGYLGNWMSDQLAYAATAEFLADYPFSTSADEIGPRPYFLLALSFKDDRIGQAIMHGFLAVSSGQEVPALYEATSLLGPALLVIPFYWLARGHGRRRQPALLLGVTAGLLPAVTQLHLEGFLSQTLALPFLFALLVTFQRALGAASVERALVAMLIMAAAASLYPEFLPILAGLVLLLVVGSGLAGRSWKSGSVLAVAVLAAPALLNPLSLPQQLPAFQRFSISLFPEYFHSRLHALQELVWMGEEFRPLGWRYGVRGLATVLMALGVVGLFGLGLRQWQRGWRRTGFLLTLGVLSLACLPLLALLRQPLNPYPIYKLTLTCGPLLALALGLMLPRLLPALLLLGATGTILTEYESTWHHHPPYPHVRSLLAEDFCWAEEQLRQLEPSEVFLVVERLHHGRWLSYHGRHHRMWLLPTLGDGFPRAALTPTGAAVYLLCEDPVWTVRIPTAEGTLLATRGRFSLWQYRSISALRVSLGFSQE
jgi:hypothetical protein